MYQLVRPFYITEPIKNLSASAGQTTDDNDAANQRWWSRRQNHRTVEPVVRRSLFLKLNHSGNQFPACRLVILIPVRWFVRHA